MNKKQAIYIIVPFLSVIFLIGAINLVSKDKESSIAENRNLTQMPTIENVRQKNFTKTYENYYTDQFVGREKLLKIDTILQILSKKSNIKGHYITEDKWLLGKTATVKKTKEDYKEATKLVNEAAQKATSLGKEVYYMPLPHKVNTLDYKYPKYVSSKYGMENSDTFISTLNKNIKIIDTGSYFVDNFNKEQLESFYFKTDHHWNSIGAYEAFKYMVKQMDKNKDINVDLNNYKYKTSYIKDKPFIGTYNKNLYNLFDTNEDVPFVDMDRKFSKKYYEMKNSKFEEVAENYIIGDRFGQDEITYGGAYTGNYPYYKIINEKAITDKKVLLIRDSYQAPLTSLFSDIFKQVEIVDPRYVNMDIDDILKKSDSDIFMIMFNNGADIGEMIKHINIK